MGRKFLVSFAHVFVPVPYGAVSLQLIVMTPKHLLRLRACTSTLQEMAEGTRFRRLINEEHVCA
jgi:2-oxoglutarate dehydrogenase complex dehydrogenase (E1) component-like enzyme